MFVWIIVAVLVTSQPIHHEKTQYRADQDNAHTFSAAPMKTYQMPEKTHFTAPVETHYPTSVETQDYEAKFMPRDATSATHHSVERTIAPKRTRAPRPRRTRSAVGIRQAIASNAPEGQYTTDATKPVDYTPSSETDMRSAFPTYEMRPATPSYDRRSTSPTHEMRSSTPSYDRRSASPGREMRSSTPSYDRRSASPTHEMRSATPSYETEMSSAAPGEHYTTAPASDYPHHDMQSTNPMDYTPSEWPTAPVDYTHSGDYTNQPSAYDMSYYGPNDYNTNAGMDYNPDTMHYDHHYPLMPEMNSNHPLMPEMDSYPPLMPEVDSHYPHMDGYADTMHYMGHHYPMPEIEHYYPHTPETEMHPHYPHMDVYAGHDYMDYQPHYGHYGDHELSAYEPDTFFNTHEPESHMPEYEYIHYPSYDKYYYGSMNHDGNKHAGHDYMDYQPHYGHYGDHEFSAYEPDTYVEHYDDEHMYEEITESKADDMFKCLNDCEFFRADNPCELWNVDDKSCMKDCLPGVTDVVTEKLNGLCAKEPVNVNPFACVMDCPIEHLDLHSAESFCPWFVQERDNKCFHDCTDDFLNMAQSYADNVCEKWNTKFINFKPQGNCPAGFNKNEDICEVCPAATYSSEETDCIQCPYELTSFPGATSIEKCFKREELLTHESHDDAPNGSDDHSEMPADSHGSYSNEDPFSEESGESSQ
jgi:hypothetical protein